MYENVILFICATHWEFHDENQLEKLIYNACLLS